MKYEVCAITDIGCIRQNNEDGFYINNMGCYNTSECFIYEKIDAPLIAFVTDGVGGSKAGEEATRLCIQTSQKETIPYDDNELVALIDKMNKGVIALRKTVDSACTLAGIVLGEDSSYIYNLGDSRVYVLEQGYLNQLSTDDTVSGLSGGNIDDNVDIKEPLMQYIGKEAVLPHIKQISNMTQFLICTDGLTDMVSLDEIEKLFSEQNDIKKIAALLVSRAKEKGGLDNITLIIVKPVKEDGNNG
ncbi:MAG: Serine/threonine phosphatase stp [Firmicutes bacterium ADurb.Bin193]|nr:MAG: Serine/threonine phosphatase stp [Firmicutes bacterium ADurb.Bin193]